VLIVAPRPKYLAGISGLSAVMMLLYFWLCLDLQDQVTFESGSKVRDVQFYYNTTPEFTAKKIVSAIGGPYYFKSNMEFLKYPYLRCDVREGTREMQEVMIKAKTGILRVSWDYSALPEGELLLNDMVRKGNTFVVTGNDPFMVLTSQRHITDLDAFIMWKKNVFLALTMICFIVLLGLQNVSLRTTPAKFFLSMTFILLISYGFLMHIFSSEGLVLSAEMRFTNPRPVMQADSLEVFIKQTDDYIKDQIPGRNNIVIMNNVIEYSLFGDLLNNPNVHFGKDGWLFYTGGVCRENYENRYPLTEQELEQMKDVLIARRDWLRDRGIRFYLVFPTMSYAVYEEKVGPRMWRYNKPSKLEQLLAYLREHTDLEIVDIQTPIMQEKKQAPMDLYFRSDSHWSHYGSFIAYSAMIDHMRKDLPEIGAPMALKDITWVDFDVYRADLYVMAALDKVKTVHEYMPANVMLKAANQTTYPFYPELPSSSPAYCFTNTSNKGPSVLVYGDSYGGFLLFYLTYNFSKTYFLYTPLFYPTIIEKEHPDIVVQEMADYCISRILYENPPLPALNDSLTQ
jgi:hypothetical protein